MPASSRILKRRIRSIGNTRKITRAMELVAASKMRRTTQRTIASRAYSSGLKQTLHEILERVDPRTHPLLAGRRSSESALVIVSASDRGLCGGYNTRLLRTAAEFIRTRPEKNIRVITVGKRAEPAMRKEAREIFAALESVSNAPTYERVRPIGEIAFREFTEGRADRVFMVYTEFVSGLAQEPRVEQLLPFIPEERLAVMRRSDEEEPPSEPDVLFEPAARDVLDSVLPRLLDSRVYQTLLESSSSEHAARMVAMQNASQNAGDILEDLVFTYNQNRQATITREMLEITAGKAAIE
ncbi:ATP synthase F1 subunit gamma [Candidatus Uhrbacteria bacterium]|nr:ATP synthase F1 subunit gamma [Candidatus Uhrbacteria bacterium]